MCFSQELREVNWLVLVSLVRLPGTKLLFDLVNLLPLMLSLA